MGRTNNADLDLHLHHSFSNSSVSRLDLNVREGERDQQMAIFFNGRVCIFDATELRARAILWSGTRGIETGIKMARPEILLHGLPGCSIKRSLKFFLQQKRTRHLQAQTRALYPYPRRQ